MSLIEFAKSIFKKSSFVVTDNGAVGRKREDEQKHLENNGGSLNQVQSNGQTLLTQAILNKDEEEYNQLLVAGASPDARNAAGETPLIVAVRNLEPESCQKAVVLLLRAGAFARDADGQGNRPIHYAVQRAGMEEVIATLYNQSGPHCACWVNKEGKTPAELAVSKEVAAFFQKMFVRQMRIYDEENAHMNEFKEDVKKLIKTGSVAPINFGPAEAEPRRITRSDLLSMQTGERQRS